MGPASAVAQTGPSDQTLRVYVPPILEWNNRTMVTRPGVVQTPYDLARINGDLTFGMSPTQVAAAMPGLPSDLDWNNLRTAREYNADIRYFWLKIDDMPAWRTQIKGCVGSASYAAFLFNRHRLFRISFRFIPDPDCPSVTAAALQVFGRYLTVGADLALSVHYRSGPAEVVDVTDPAESQLVPIRWRMSGT